MVATVFPSIFYETRCPIIYEDGLEVSMSTSIPCKTGPTFTNFQESEHRKLFPRIKALGRFCTDLHNRVALVRLIARDILSYRL